MKFAKKLLGENDIEAVLQRLDRLTLDEARTTAAQTLHIIYGLVQNMRFVMEGEQTPHDQSLVGSSMSFLIDGKASLGCVREALGVSTANDELVP